MKEVYSKYWIDAREKIYGFLEYDKNLCNFICQYFPKGGEFLEVAIGTGYPFADFFSKKGYSVHGIDIAPILIGKMRELYPDIKAYVGDAEDLEYPDNYFHCVYCFHSTWYFPNLKKVINEMIRVTRSGGGMIMFDIQNLNNQDINRGFKERLSKTRGTYRIKRCIKNIAKVILNRGTPDWSIVCCHEVPVYPEVIYKYLYNYPLCTFDIYVKNDDESLEIKKELSSFSQYGRLVFVLRKL